MAHNIPEKFLFEDEREWSIEQIEGFYAWWQDFVQEKGSLIKAILEFAEMRNVTKFCQPDTPQL